MGVETKGADMKRRSTCALKVTCNIDNESVDTIQFLFKQYDSEDCNVKLVKEYPSEDVEYDSDKDYYIVRFSVDDTATFAEDQEFFCDPRVTLTSGDVPETTNIKLWMNKTLWSEEDLDDDQVSGA